MDAEQAVQALIATLVDHPLVQDARLVGSRSRGDATRWSDWDIKVAVDDFDVFAPQLPDLCAPVHPLVGQGDRLSPEQCWMLIVSGPAKIDVIFDEPHAAEPPWVVSGDTLV